MAFITVVNMATASELLEWFIVWHFSSSHKNRLARENKHEDSARNDFLFDMLWHQNQGRGGERQAKHTISHKICACLQSLHVKIDSYSRAGSRKIKTKICR